ncbi:MAG TPA: hypothetical protein VD997_15225 [Phycisphaerales bacterium]|nr:hypothetical protein [Phycisphaerales bacterium]
MSNNTHRVPRKTVDFVNWLKPRGPKWKTQASVLGLTTSQGTAVDAASASLLAKFEAREAAEQAFRNAVAELDAELTSARTIVGDCMRTIDAFASNSSNPTAIYTTADVPAPQSPKPTPPPGLPADLRVTLGKTGSLELAWKCVNPGNVGGVVYEVKRSIGSDAGPFEYLGVSGTRKFTDDTLPAGSGSVYYQITGVRSTQRGPTEVFLVKFGVTGGGFAISSVTTSGKLAA